MRFISILFNPIGHLVWWIVRRSTGWIDRILGPTVGWIAALLLVTLCLFSLAGAFYGQREPLMKLAGLSERPPVTTFTARVVSAQTVSRKTMTIRQNIVAEYEAGGETRQVSGSVTEPSIEEKAPGEEITVYVAKDGSATFADPEDPYLESFMAAITIGLPALGLFFSFRYLRYRSSLRRETVAASPMGQPAAISPQGFTRSNDLVVRGRDRIKSREERLREEAEIIRQMHDQANRRKR